MQALQDRCFELTAYLVRGMRALCHSTEPSLPLCVLYGANYESDQQAELVPSRQGQKRTIILQYYHSKLLINRYFTCLLRFALLAHCRFMQDPS